MISPSTVDSSTRTFFHRRFLGDGQRDGDLLGAGALAHAFLLEDRDLLGPGFDLNLPLVVQVGELGAAPLHLGQAAIEHLDLLAAFGEFEPRLRQRFLLLVAIGTPALRTVSIPAIFCFWASTLPWASASWACAPCQALERFVVLALEAGEVVFETLQAVARIVMRALGILFLGVKRGSLLGSGEHVGPAGFERGFSFGEGGIEPVDDRALVVMGLLLGHHGLAGFAQVDLALHDAVRRLLVVAAVDESATIDEIALGGRNHQEAEARVGLPELEEGIQVVSQEQADNTAAAGCDDSRLFTAETAGRRNAGSSPEFSAPRTPNPATWRHTLPTWSDSSCERIFCAVERSETPIASTEEPRMASRALAYSGRTSRPWVTGTNFCSPKIDEKRPWRIAFALSRSLPTSPAAAGAASGARSSGRANDRFPAGDAAPRGTAA